MPTYDEIKTLLNNPSEVRDHLARAISGKNPDGTDFVDVDVENYLEMHGIAVVFDGSNNVTVNDRNRLISALERGDSKALPVWIPAGHHSILGGGVQAERQGASVIGAGANVSILDGDLTTPGEALLKIGPDSAGGPGVGPGDWPGGRVADLSVWNGWQNGWVDHPAFNKGPIGIQISQVHPDMERLDVRGFNAAYDMVGNCYGTRWASCWAKYGWNNYGMLLRAGDQNGQDHTWDNCWLSGRKGGVMIAGWGAGYHFRGGQISGGTALASTDDWRGAVLMGLGWDDALDDPDFGNQGTNRNVTFVGVNFEGTHGMWQIRMFQPQRSISFIDCHFMGAGSDLEDFSPLGVFKADALFDGSVTFSTCSAHRYYRGVNTGLGNSAGDDPDGPLLVALKGSMAGYPNEPMIIEDGTIIQDCRADNPVVDLANTYAGQGMFTRARVSHHGRSRNGQQQLGPVRIAGNPDGNVYRSADFGDNWIALA